MLKHNRVPYKAKGRHGSRVQRANYLARLNWEYDLWTYNTWCQRRAALGMCPYSGETFRACKSTDLCDCFDYPEYEHYRTEGAG